MLVAKLQKIASDVLAAAGLTASKIADDIAWADARLSPPYSRQPEDQVNVIQANAIKTTIQVVIDLLVRGEFDVLAAMSRGRLLNAAQMAAAINDYGRTFVAPPEHAWELLDVILVTNSAPSVYDVRMPLFTKEEGRSDLTLSLTLREFGRGLLETEIDGIYVP